MFIKKSYCFYVYFQYNGHAWIGEKCLLFILIHEQLCGIFIYFSSVPRNPFVKDDPPAFLISYPSSWAAPEHKGFFPLVEHLEGSLASFFFSFGAFFIFHGHPIRSTNHDTSTFVLTSPVPLHSGRNTYLSTMIFIISVSNALHNILNTPEHPLVMYALTARVYHTIITMIIIVIIPVYHTERSELERKPLQWVFFIGVKYAWTQIGTFNREKNFHNSNYNIKYYTDVLFFLIDCLRIFTVHQRTQIWFHTLSAWEKI